MRTGWLFALGLAGACAAGASHAQKHDWNVTLGPVSHDPDESDRLTIAQLKADGSDITKPTDVIFYLYFPSEGKAEALRAKILSMGFTVDVHPVDNPAAWALVANKTMVPNEGNIVAMSHQFTLLAASQSGDYDGWEAAVVK